VRGGGGKRWPGRVQLGLAKETQWETFSGFEKRGGEGGPGGPHGGQRVGGFFLCGGFCLFFGVLVFLVCQGGGGEVDGIKRGCGFLGCQKPHFFVKEGGPPTLVTQNKNVDPQNHKNKKPPPP